MSNQNPESGESFSSLKVGIVWKDKLWLGTEAAMNMGFRKKVFKLNN